jgi:hypothetical protein
MISFIIAFFLVVTLSALLAYISLDSGERRLESCREVITVEDDVEGNWRIITAAFKLQIF